MYLAYKKDKHCTKTFSDWTRGSSFQGQEYSIDSHKEEVFMIDVVRCRKNYPREVDAPPVEVFKVMWDAVLSTNLVRDATCSLRCLPMQILA